MFTLILALALYLILTLAFLVYATFNYTMSHSITTKQQRIIKSSSNSIAALSHSITAISNSLIEPLQTFTSPTNSITAISHSITAKPTTITSISHLIAFQFNHIQIPKTFIPSNILQTIHSTTTFYMSTNKYKSTINTNQSNPNFILYSTTDLAYDATEDPTTDTTNDLQNNATKSKYNALKSKYNTIKSKYNAINQNIMQSK
eukprot:150625_1